jgi:hypothetical protein
MKQSFVFVSSLALALGLAADVPAQVRIANQQTQNNAQNANVASNLSLHGGGSLARPTVAPFARNRVQVEKLKGTPHIPGPHLGPPPPGTQLFNFSVGQPVALLAGLTAGLQAPGVFEALTPELRIWMPAKTSPGLEEAVQVFIDPPTATSITFECFVTPNQHYTATLDAYYLAGGAGGVADHNDVLATTTALSSTGTITAVYDPVSTPPDIVWLTLWSNTSFSFTGCRAKRS